ncbi:MAG: hypothetical protein JSR21_18155 [Proteobacteria bacterium]|nr:hypothetical protein [Pseudomonadota bacterium]
MSDEQAQVGLPEGRVVAAQGLPQSGREAVDRVFGNCAAAGSGCRFQSSDAPRSGIARELGGIEPLFQRRIGDVDQALFYEFE